MITTSVAKTPERKGRLRRSCEAMFFIRPLNRSMVDPDDSLMHVSLILNLESVRELYNHYKVLILDKDEKVWSVLTKRMSFTKSTHFGEGNVYFWCWMVVEHMSLK
jgi:hypothetical protein